MPYVNCMKCSRLFYAKPFHLGKGQGKFCSKKCHYASMQRGIQFKCAVCGRQVLKTPSKIKHSKSGKFFCTKSCQTIWRNSQYSGEKHKNWKGGFSTYRDLLVKTGKPQECRRCRTKDFRVLTVHHIDENHKNNRIKNLTWLCHNCHILVHHDKVEGKKFLTSLKTFY